MAKARFSDKVTGLWAFETQMPFQKYQGPPIVVRLQQQNLFFLAWNYLLKGEFLPLHTVISDWTHDLVSSTLYWTHKPK